MSNAYRNMMEQQCLSDGAQQAFYEKLHSAQPQRKKNVLPKAILIAACICLLIPTAVLAAEHFFGSSWVETVQRNILSGRAGKGYDINYTNVYSRPISDFSPEIQSFDGYKSVVYDSWEDAEAELGIDLITNSVLSDRATYPEKQYNLDIDSGTHVSGSSLHHCFANYRGKDGQLYCATVTAAYRRDEMQITIRSTVTAEHPAISQEREQELHWIGVTYPQTDVEEILQEQYTAESGLPATIIVIDRTGARSTDYEATFAANGASYRITVSGYPGKREAEAKELLLDILEGFSF